MINENIFILIIFILYLLFIAQNIYYLKINKIIIKNLLTNSKLNDIKEILNNNFKFCKVSIFISTIFILILILQFFEPSHIIVIFILLILRLLITINFIISITIYLKLYFRNIKEYQKKYLILSIILLTFNIILFILYILFGYVNDY